MNHRLVLTFLMLLSVVAWAGDSVGNFTHKFEESFDFHIAYPSDWHFEEQTDPSSEATKIWEVNNSTLVKNPAEESSLTIHFLSNLEVRSQQELLALARKRNPEIRDWDLSSASDEIISVQSSDIVTGPRSTRSYEYYLPIERQVIFIETKKHEADAGASIIDLILSTISRASRPPEIRSIELATPGQVIGVGEKLCYHIYVNDFKNSFTSASLTSINFKKHNPLFSKKSATWNSEESRFEVCVDVRANNTSVDLMIQSLEITNQRGQNLSCRLVYFEGSELNCGDKPTKISIPTPSLDISRPDREGPSIQHLEWDKSTLKLQVQIHDQSPIGGGVIQVKGKGGEKSKFIFPDQIQSGQIEIDLSTVSSPGWNTIKGLAFFDENGERTVLVQNEINRENSGSFYYYKSAAGKTKSNFPVINFLYTGEAR